MNVSEQLDSRQVKYILSHILNINFNPEGKEWQTILSPLRDEKNPSFSININTGGWIDHGITTKGDIVDLMILLLNIDTKQAIRQINDIVVNTFSGEPLARYSSLKVFEKHRERPKDSPGKRYWVYSSRPAANKDKAKPKKRTNNRRREWSEPKIDTSLKTSKSDESEEIEELFEEQAAETANERLQNEPHYLVKQMSSYDLVSKETLLKYNCGLQEEYGKDWISIPYPTGTQLYRREDGEKVIRMVKGSKPKGSWFGVEQCTGRPILFIAKSPREAMLLDQRYGQTVDVLAITSGEVSSVSQQQAKQMRRLTQKAHTIKVLFDCDTPQAKKTARSFSRDIAQKVSRNCDVQLIDIWTLSDKQCKDITDYFKEEPNPEKVYQQILAKGQRLGKASPKPQDILNKQLNVQDAPFHSSEVYEALPKRLAAVTKLISRREEKDIFLHAALPVLASHLPNVVIPHNDGKYSPDIYSLVIAKPGTGKGVAEKARLLGNHLNRKLIEESRKDMARWESLPKKEREQTPKPIQKQLFLPGNTSSRALYDFLEINEGRGLIFETEIDTLINAASQEWGDYTDVIRKSFHHEPVSLRRKTDDMYIERPELSIFMSGTFDQFKNMFESAENGHFSRYAFYTFEPDIKWKTHRPTDASTQLDEQLDSVSATLLSVYQTLKKRESPLVIHLEDRHWDIIDNTFKKKMIELEDEGMSRYLQSSNQRIAVITIRIAAILCVIRNVFEVDLKILNKPGICITDADLKAGIRLANNFFDHTKRLFQMLPKADSLQSKGVSFKLFYYKLPQQFQTNEAYLYGFEVGVSKRTVRNYLSSLVNEGLLLKTEHGTYNKVEP